MTEDVFWMRDVEQYDNSSLLAMRRMARQALRRPHSLKIHHSATLLYAVTTAELASRGVFLAEGGDNV